MISIRTVLVSVALALVAGTADAASTPQATFYVSPAGSDSNSGTLAAPFLTIGAAQQAVRGLTASMNGNIQVFLRGGVYPLASPLVFGSADSGTNGYQVIYQAYNNEVPVISGGVAVTGWVLDHGSVYRAPLSRTTKLRSLFVNGVRAQMTRGGAIQGYGNANTFTIQGTESWTLNGAGGSAPDDVQFSPSQVQYYANPANLELVQNYTFNSTIVGVRALTSTNNYVTFQLQQPYAALAASMQYTTGLNVGGAFYVQNAYELLNSPGQFYFNTATQTLYYYSRGENMATAQVFAPTTEGLVQIHGVSNTNRVANLQFIGLTFAYDHWQMYNVAGSNGMAATQSIAGQVRYAGSNGWHGDHYNDTQNPQASIDIQNASGIVLQGNSFQHLSSGTAVGLTNDVINSTVKGNSFIDLAGNAVNVGNAQNGYTNTSVLYPPNVWGVCTNDTVQDNFVRRPNQMYYQFEGIAAAYVNGLQLANNDISGTGYDAISMGWGWSDSPATTVMGNNHITSNRINQSNQILDADGGSIYTLGPQPNSTIMFNYVSNGLTALYTDQGSAYLTIEYNTISNQGWLYIPDLYAETNLTVMGNYFNTNVSIVNAQPSANDTVVNNYYETTFDSNAQGIINASGLEPNYQYLQAAPVVTALSATTKASGPILLSWQSTGVATSYNIYRATTPGGEGATPYQSGVTGSIFSDPSVSTGSTYYYKVTAVGLAGEASASNETSAAASSSSTPPSTTPLAQTITFNALPAEHVGATLTVSASASSGLPVTFSVVPNGNCSVSGNVVTFLNVGNCGVVASQAGNATYAAAANVGQIVVVNPAASPTLTSQTITFNAIPAQHVGGTLTVSATASSGLPVSFSVIPNGNCSVAGNVVSFLNFGNCGVVASQAGNGTYAAAANVGQIVVVNNPVAQTITFNPIAVPQGVGKTLTVSATASSGLPVSFSVVPNGNCSVSGNVVTFLNYGNCGVVASQAGNGTYSAAANVGQIIVVNH